MSLIRLVYRSAPTFRMDGDSVGVVIKDILESARKNNPKRGVTGALLFTTKHFFQALEGESESVKDLVRTISEDPRHDGFQTLQYKRTRHRYFSAWSMAHVKLDAFDFETLDRRLSSEKPLTDEELDKLIAMMSEAADRRNAVTLKPLFAKVMA